MEAEEYINSKVIKDNGYEYHSCEVGTKEDAIRAIEMARNEKTNAIGMQGWICPKCGSVYSPYTSRCTFCGNLEPFTKITCN